jgi:hypothetical protein
MAKNKIKMAVEGNSTDAPERVLSREDAEHERRWKAEAALEDIQRAEKHKTDKALMKDVKACAKEKMKHMSKVVSGK